MTFISACGNRLQRLCVPLGLIIVLSAHGTLMAQDYLKLSGNRTYKCYIIALRQDSVLAIPFLDPTKAGIAFSFQEINSIKTENPYLRYQLQKMGKLSLIGADSTRPLQENATNRFDELAYETRDGSVLKKGLSDADWRKADEAYYLLERAKRVNTRGWVGVGVGNGVLLVAGIASIAASFGSANSRQATTYGVIALGGLVVGTVSIATLHLNSLFTRKPAYELLRATEVVAQEHKKRPAKTGLFSFLGL
jgi:hypothetical protein